MYAMTHIAIHDALNAIDRRSRPTRTTRAARGATPLRSRGAPRPRATSWSRSSASSRPVPAGCVDAGIASVEADYAAALAAIPRRSRQGRGIAVGRAAAAAILALRAADGSDTPLSIRLPQGTDPGEYRFTPGNAFAFAPGLGRRHAVRAARQLAVPPGSAVPVTSRRYTADFNEVKRLGGDGVTTPSARTADQTEIALFWIESSPLQWNRIAGRVAASARLDLWENARLFGLLNMALADGYIGSFDTKYHYSYWRPVTAIRTRASDGNPDTTPTRPGPRSCTTPPIPDYDSATPSRAARRRRSCGGTSAPTARFAACSPRCRPEAPAPTRHAVTRRTRASPRRPRRTGFRASSSASTSARRWRTGSRTAPRSAGARVDQFLRPVR